MTADGSCKELDRFSRLESTLFTLHKDLNDVTNCTKTLGASVDADLKEVAQDVKELTVEMTKLTVDVRGLVAALSERDKRLEESLEQGKETFKRLGDKMDGMTDKIRVLENSDNLNRSSRESDSKLIMEIFHRVKDLEYAQTRIDASIKAVATVFTVATALLTLWIQFKA